MTEKKKEYDYLAFGRGGENGDLTIVDTIGFVKVENIRSAKDGDIRSFGLPLKNVQGKVAAMFPDDFKKEDVDETFWLNVAMFNNETYKLADRLTKAIEGKESVRIRVTGTAKVNEYEGSKRIEVTANDFHILWADTYKGTNVGGGPDGYSYASGLPGKEAGIGHLAVQGFVNRPELRTMKNGKKVLGFSLALNKASKAVNYALKSNIDEEAIWVDAAIFDNDYFPQAEQAAKAIRKGTAISALGFAKIEEYEGKEKVRLTIRDFKVLLSGKTESEVKSEEKVPVTSGATAKEDSPFVTDEDFGIDFDDDDLPF